MTLKLPLFKQLPETHTFFLLGLISNKPSKDSCSTAFVCVENVSDIQLIYKTSLSLPKIKILLLDIKIIN